MYCTNQSARKEINVRKVTFYPETETNRLNTEYLKSPEKLVNTPKEHPTEEIEVFKEKS